MGQQQSSLYEPRVGFWEIGSHANLFWFWDVTAITWLSSTFTYRLPIVSLLCNCRNEMYQCSQHSYRNSFARIFRGASKSPRALCMSTVFGVDPCQSRDRPVPARVVGSQRNIGTFSWLILVNATSAYTPIHVHTCIHVHAKLINTTRHDTTIIQIYSYSWLCLWIVSSWRNSLIEP
jgi:hypothetical protein